jgi:hypothetical protein
LSTSVISSDDKTYLTYDECIEHIRFTLADICVQAGWKNSVSMWRFLNRTSFLFQMPLCFAVFRLTDTGYIFERSTMRDPFYRHGFEETLQSIGVRFNGTPTESASISPYIVRMLATDFYILALQVEGNPHKPGRRQSFTYVPLASDSVLGRVLTRIFSPFGTPLKLMGIEEHLNQSFTHLFSSQAYIDAKHDNPTKSRITPDGIDLVDRIYGKLKGQLIDLEIERILPSPIIKRNSVSRFLLFVKTFDRTSIRFSSYFYNIRICMPQMQKQQIADGLTCAMLDSMTPFHNRKATEWIRDRIKANAFGEIFDVLETPLSKASRLFCEFTLLSGASMINIDPFSGGDIGWYESEYGVERRDDYNHEMRRFAALHYILLCMAGDDIARPALLTIPIRVDGTTWMCVTTIVGMNEHPHYPGIIDAAEFEWRFLFYNSLMRDFETRLRRKTKQCYLAAVSELFSDQVRAASREGNGQATLEAKDYAAIASRMVDLCRLYPFRPIMFAPRQCREELCWEALPIGDWYRVDCGIAGDNPFFDRTPLREFMQAYVVREHIMKVMNSEFGLQKLGRENLTLIG